MKFTEAESTVICSTWCTLLSSGQFLNIGTDALERLFLAFPLTKRYFSHLDMRNGSSDVKQLGKLFMRMIGNCVDHLDELEHHKHLFSVSDCHFQQLLNTPSEYKLLSHALQISLGFHFPNDFTEPALTVWDKFLSALPKFK